MSYESALSALNEHVGELVKKEKLDGFEWQLCVALAALIEALQADLNGLQSRLDKIESHFQIDQK